MKININTKRILVVALTTIIALSAVLTVNAQSNPQQKQNTDAMISAISNAFNAKKANEEINGTILGSDYYLENAGISTDWTAVTWGRYSEIANNRVVRNYPDLNGGEQYLTALEKYVTETYSENNGFISTTRPTDWHRIILAVLALGGNPESFGTYNGKQINLVADGTYNSIIDFGTQGLNSWVWGLLALNSSDYEIPADAKYSTETFVAKILENELKNGGWTYFGDTPDPDMTSMVIMALSPYYNNNQKVTESVNKAVELLSATQNKEGDFSSYGTANSMTTAQVLMAMISINIDPLTDKRFIKDGNTVVDGLFEYLLNGGGFCYSLADDDGVFSSFANDQALQAMVAYVRYLRGQTPFYDFSDTSKKEIAITGDANIDGEVNVVDATVIQKHIADIAPLDFTALCLCDVLNDSDINIKDATQIQRMSAGLAD